MTYPYDMVKPLTRVLSLYKQTQGWEVFPQLSLIENTVECLLAVAQELVVPTDTLWGVGGFINGQMYGNSGMEFAVWGIGQSKEDAIKHFKSEANAYSRYRRFKSLGLELVDTDNAKHIDLLKSSLTHLKCFYVAPITEVAYKVWNNYQNDSQYFLCYNSIQHTAKIIAPYDLSSEYYRNSRLVS